MKRERYQEEDFEGYVRELIRLGFLNATEAGIAKLMLDIGYDNLSEKQKYVFDKAIERNSIEECKGGDGSIPWCEMIAALDNGGYCSWCQHRMGKLEQE